MHELTRVERIQATLFLLVGAIVTIGVILALVGLPLSDGRVTYRLRFTESVVNIDDGTPVRYKGVRYGEVREIAVNPENPEEILVTLEVDRQTPIKVSTTARIASASLLGPYYIELLDSRAGSPTLPPGSDIPAAASTIARILKTGETVGDQLIQLFDNVEDWATADKREIFFGTLTEATNTMRVAQTSLNTLTAEAEETLRAWRELALVSGDILTTHRESLGRLIQSTESTMKGIQRFIDSGRLEEVADTAQSSLQQLSTEGTSTLTAIRSFLENNAIAPYVERAVVAMEQLERALSSAATNLAKQGSETARSDLGPALQEFRRTADALTRLMELLERQPRALIFGDSPAEKRLPGEKR